MNDMIEISDKVLIEYVYGFPKVAIVKQRAVDSGDMWYFEGEDGEVFAQNPQSCNLNRIFLLEKYEPPDVF